MDGIQSGVPTLTTSTLTPTTLRSIEDSFIQLVNEPINEPFRAGFIPPPLAPFSASTTGTTGTIAATAPTVYNGNNLQEYNDITAHDTESDEESKSSWNGQQYNEDNSLATTDNSSAATDSTSFQNGSNGLGNNSSLAITTSNASSTNDFTTVLAAVTQHGANSMLNINNNHITGTTSTPRRHLGGRRPTKSSNMTPEEEEKRRVRRERNKEAAARCRKRRVDQTNELLDEVSQLEKKRETLLKDIESLKATEQELECVLDMHRPTCQKIRQDLLSVSTYAGLIAPTNSAAVAAAAAVANSDLSDVHNNNSSLGRSMSPIDIKPVILQDQILDFIKNEPLESALDSNSSLDHDGPPSTKRLLLDNSNNPMIPPPLPLPNVSTITASLNTPIVTTAPISFGSFSSNNATLQTLNALNKPCNISSKQRPNSLPTNLRNSTQLALNVDGSKQTTTDINGVAIQTPSTGNFNFDSLMDGGTGLTPVSGPLIPNCSSQNKHPLELTTPTSEPSKLVSL